MVLSFPPIYHLFLFLCLAFSPELGFLSHDLLDLLTHFPNRDLVSFQAEQMGGEVLLEIQFDQESQIDSFWIERSDDGLSFKKVAGKTIMDSTSSFFRVFDHLPTIKKEESYVYYKVKMFHLEGQVDYSSIGGLMLQKPQKWEVDFRPDSTNTYLQVEVFAPQKERIELRIINGARKSYAVERTELHKGINRLQIDIADWPNQFYFLTVKSKTYFERYNFMKN